MIPNFAVPVAGTASISNTQFNSPLFVVLPEDARI